MRVLLTGASGFIGKHVLLALESNNIDTVCVGRFNPGGSTEFIEADLLETTEFGSIVRNAGATHLLHLAWYTEHGKYWTSPLNLRWAEATVRLVDSFCSNGGRHVVVAGTCAEYGWEHGYCREETTPLDPATFYGQVKDATRRLVMATCAQHQAACAWGRVFIPYGSGEASARLIPSLISFFKGKTAAFGVNASAFRDFLHVADVADAFVALLQEGTPDGAYNISSAVPVQLEHVVRILADLLHGDPAAVLRLSSVRTGEPQLLIGENNKLQSLGWHPRISLSQGLNMSVDCFSA